MANIGDSSAVLGVCHSNNVIVPRSLSRAHTVENLDEVNRIRKAHPISESATVLKGRLRAWVEGINGVLNESNEVHLPKRLGGRLLGVLYTLRAFGDVRYKWPMNLQRVVLEPLGVPPPSHQHTPPYLTALPEVFYHKLTANDKFLVLASDGLWEW